MAMDPREYELIALSHVISRYKITGELPTINGQPFNLNEFKSQLFAGVSGYDPDININIDTVKMENTVVDCDNEHEQETKPAEPVPTETVAVQAEPATVPADPAPVEEPISPPAETNQETPSPEKSTISGKLFQFFSKDNKNESQ